MRSKRTKGSATALAMTLIISGSVASFLGVRQYDRITTVPAWVASADLAAGSVITRNALEKERVPRDIERLDDLRQLVGRILNTPKKAGEPLQAADLSPPRRSWLAEQVPDGRVLYTLVPGASTIPYSQLRNGDRLDVLARGRRGVRTVARDVRLVGAMKPRSTAAAATGRGLMMQLAAGSSRGRTATTPGVPLVVAVEPSHIYALASLSPDDEVSLVLHGSRGTGELPDLRPRRPGAHAIEVYNGLKRQRVQLNSRLPARPQAL